jgi:ribonucleoside-diphosphate reductase alpha chain
MEVFDEIDRIEKKNPDFVFNIKESLLNAIKFIENGDLNEDKKRIEICDYIAKSCASCISKDPDFGKISVKYELEKLDKIIDFKNDYMKLIDKQYKNEIISEKYYNFVKDNPKIFEFINEERNFKLDIFGLKTLERSYLLKENQEIKQIIENTNTDIAVNICEYEENFDDYVNFKSLENKYNLESKHTQIKDDKKIQDTIFLETPQMLWLRCAVEIHGINSIDGELDSIEHRMMSIKETYDILSNLYATHATPTLFNSGRKFPQLSSCYILDCEDDLIDIGNNFSKMMQISKYGGGLGINLSKIRSGESLIRSNGGKASGVIPLCRVLDKIANYANQSGLRKGSIACYLEVWHSDILEFIEMRMNTGNEDMKARDLFFGVWTCDLFMHAVENKDYWYLMSPSEAKGLNDVYGKEFSKLYYKYVLEGKYIKKINAEDLMKSIIVCQHETGMPYMMFKDSINKKSNQENIGIIKSSNLCTEIVEHTSNAEIAVCNLASLSLPKFVKDDKTFDYEELGKVVRIMTKNLNIVINANFYPTKETLNSNNKNRPVGLGVQGLADVYIKMDASFESEKALKINKKIFECIYYYSLLESNELAKRYGPYHTFHGSPFSRGILQFHMWGKKFKDMDKELDYNWKELCENIKTHGTMNSLITSLMPTASTSQIMGNNESIEPYASNLYVRKTLSGEYLVVNKNLISDLREINKWNKETYSELLFDNGSVQNLDISIDLKNKYKTAYEIKQSVIIKQSAERGIFIDQTQSLNLFTQDSSIPKIFSCLMRGWKSGLKTGIYYLRTTPSVTAEQFSIDIEEIDKIRTKRGLKGTEKKKAVKKKTVIEECLMCSS